MENENEGQEPADWKRHKKKKKEEVINRWNTQLTNNNNNELYNCIITIYTALEQVHDQTSDL